MHLALIIFSLIINSTNSYLLQTLKLLIPPINFQVEKFLDQLNLSKECTTDLKLLQRDIFEMKLWAFNMLDSAAKPGAGLLTGNINLMGNYDQCLSVKENVSNRIIQGKYCTAIIGIDDKIVQMFKPPNSDFLLKLWKNQKNTQFAEPLNLLFIDVPTMLGICVPKSCSAEDLTSATRTITKTFKLPVKPHFRDVLCRYENKPLNIKALDFCVYISFSVILLIVITSTVCDLHLRLAKRTPNVVAAFSVVANFEKLIGDQPQAGFVTCLNGLKVVCCLWVSLTHFLVFLSIRTEDRLVFVEWRNKLEAAYAWSAFFAVSSFLTISGFSTTHNYLKISDKNQLLSFYFYRLSRLTPPLLASTFINASFLKLFQNGPFSEAAIHATTNRCHATWWRSLFYVFLLADFECSVTSWYLTIDSRLYICTPLVLFFIRKHPKRVLVGVTGGILISIAYSFVVTVWKNLGATSLEWNGDYFNHLYTSTVYHMGCWLIGVLLGYILHQKKNNKSYGFHFLLLSSAICIMHRLMADQIDYVNSDYNKYRAAFWNSFAPQIWCTALSVVIYSCATGHGGFINYILSHPIFRIYSKLTYSMYLIQGSVTTVLIGTIKETTYFPGYATIFDFSQFLIILTLFSLLFYLTFDAPFRVLRNHILPKRVQDNKKIK